MRAQLVGSLFGAREIFVRSAGNIFTIHNAMTFCIDITEERKGNYFGTARSTWELLSKLQTYSSALLLQYLKSVKRFALFDEIEHIYNNQTKTAKIVSRYIFQCYT